MIYSCYHSYVYSLEYMIGRNYFLSIGKQKINHLDLNKKSKFHNSGNLKLNVYYAVVQ